MTTETMLLSGDDNTPGMPMTEANVNHLRRLLAWMRCEYMLDEHMQRGYLQGAAEAAAAGMMRALMSAAERERVGRAGRERVLAQLSPEVVARRFNQLLGR